MPWTCEQVSDFFLEPLRSDVGDKVRSYSAAHTPPIYFAPAHLSACLNCLWTPRPPCQVEQYKKSVREEVVDGRALLQLSDKDLSELSVTVGHRKILRSTLNTLGGVMGRQQVHADTVRALAKR